MEVCLESSGWAGVSPRISFSHDLPQADISESSIAGGSSHHRLDLSLPLDAPAPSDFDFSLGANIFSHDSSLADDLFSDGKLLPLPIKNPSSSSSLPLAAYAPAAPEPTRARRRKRGSLREIMAGSHEDSAHVGRSSEQKSFWRFRRSSSLNCGGGSGSSLCPFPLLRSKSSGSNIKQCNTSILDAAAGISKGDGDTSRAPFTDLFKKVLNEPKTTRVYYYSGNSRRSHGNGVRINPILNVPTPSSMGIFSFLLCKRGDKSMAKSSAMTCSP